jgi:RNA polymerase sigma-70 factor (ECF subfamily)
MGVALALSSRELHRPWAVVLAAGFTRRRAGGNWMGLNTSDYFGQLIRAVAERRDRAAFAGLFTHFAPRLKAMAMRMGASNEAAEEIAQEAMVAVWRKAAYFDPERASASTWIFAIARNMRIDLVRSDRRVAQLATGWPEPDAVALPDQIVDAGDRERRIRDVLSDLPEEQLRVIQLSFFEGRAHGDISNRLGIPLGTVKSRLRLALTRLRAALDDLS